MARTSDFLEAQGQSITFEDEVEMKAYFEQKDFCELAREQAKLKNDHGERYSLRFYLLKLPTMVRFQFPLTVMFAETPDFALTAVGLDVGIEVTQSTEESLAKDKSILERSKGIYDLIEFGPLGHALKEKGVPLSSEPFYGDQDIELLTDVCKAALVRKLERLNAGHYSLHRSNQLLLLDTYGLPIQDADDKRERFLRMLSAGLMEACSQVRSARRFDNVLLLKNGYLYIDLLGRPRVL